MSKAMNLIESAVSRFRDGCSCSQAVFSTYAETMDWDRETALKVSAGFGGGMGRMAETCGAVTGAMMAIGLKHASADVKDAQAREKTYALVRQFADEFRARHGALDCRDLLGCDISTPEGRQQAHDRDTRGTVCSQLVRDAAELLEELL
jgi:C_GCAxxG_C_C family probable redox protein